MQTYMQKYYEKNKEKIKEERRAHYADNKDRICKEERERREKIKQENPQKHHEILVKQKARALVRRKSGEERARQKEWESKNRPLLRKKTNDRRKADRIEAINAYGGKCHCCGEMRFEFLAIDHVNGGGAEHRKLLKSAHRRDFPRYLKSLGYPSDYRILCHNCNQSLGVYGYCPHHPGVAANEITVNIDYK